jgi:hypothetical protein
LLSAEPEHSAKCFYKKEEKNFAECRSWGTRQSKKNKKHFAECWAGTRQSDR